MLISIEKFVGEIKAIIPKSIDIFLRALTLLFQSKIDFKVCIVPKAFSFSEILTLRY